MDFVKRKFAIIYYVSQMRQHNMWVQRPVKKINKTTENW